MNTEQYEVRQLMNSIGQHIASYPTIDVPSDQVELRVQLIKEEITELLKAMRQKNLIEIADGIADSLYVVYGAAVLYGIDIDPIFYTVHKNNMEKIRSGHRGENGKWIKPEGFPKPDIEKELKEQINLRKKGTT